ncbi:MAG TPA: PAS domain S-box protein [Thermoanaerobaculia bacterium]|jgi:PAS domain S-box-containing protein
MAPERSLARRVPVPKGGWEHLVLSNAQDLISVHGADSFFLFASGVCRRLLGYEPEELVGRPLFDFLHLEDRRPAEDAYRALCEGVDDASVTCRLQRRDGSYLWTEIRVRAVRRPGGDTGYRVALVRDVTAHREAAEQQTQLRHALERAAFEWRSTFDAIETPILLLGLDGRVQRVNRAAKQLLGEEYRNILGCPVGEVGSGQPWEAVAALAGRILESFSPEVCEATDEKRAQTWEVEAAVSATAEEGDAKIILQVRDITKTARLQESLRRSETMAALGAVVGGVAHEVRNPLFGMSAVLDAFESRFGDRAEHQPYLPLLRAELHRMAELMQALLDYGKPARFEMAPGDLAVPLERALAFCRPLAERQGVRLTVEPWPPAAPRVLHDAERLAQAFKNVVENAVQHTPRGGEVLIRLSEVSVGGSPWVRLSVRDRGTGFAAADLPRVLEPFFSRRAGGTGLGLSIVSRVVEGHAGNVRVGNHPEGGAVVDLEFPCTRAMEVRSRAEGQDPDR